jgi:hypothetical protein
MHVDFVVRFDPDAASALAGGTPPETAGFMSLASVLADFGAQLRPQFPGVTDPELRSYYILTGVADEDAEAITAALRELDEVEYAYPQPTPFPA